MESTLIKIKIKFSFPNKKSIGVNFINILFVNFSYKSASRIFSLVTKPKHN